MPRLIPQHSFISRPLRRAWLPLLAFLTLVAWQLVLQAGGSSGWLAADPTPGSRLPQPPAQVVLAFSDPLDPVLSRIDVFDSQGQRRDAADSGVDPLDPARLTVSLRALPTGDYTVNWRAISDLSGATSAGSYRFRVGSTLAGASGPHEDDPIFAPDSHLLVDLGRLVSLLGAVIVFGGAVGVWGMLRGDAATIWVARLDRAFVLLVVGQALCGVTLVLSTGGCVAPVECPIRAEAWLMDTRAGLLWMAQIVLMLALFVAAQSHERQRIGPFRLGLSAALAAAIFSWGAPEGVDVTLRILHGWALAIGLGVLVPYLGRATQPQQVVDRVTDHGTTGTDLARPLSAGALGALALTGAGLLWRAGADLPDGTITSHVALLILELCAVAGAGVIAIVWRRSTADGAATRWIEALGLSALGLGLIILWSLGSGFQSSVGHPSQRVVLDSSMSSKSGELEAIASLQPARAGANTLQLHLPSSGEAAPDMLTVMLVTLTDPNPISQPVTLVRVAADRFERRLDLAAGGYQVRATSSTNDVAGSHAGTLVVDPVPVRALVGQVASALSPWLMLVLIPLVGFVIPLSLARLAPDHLIYRGIGRVVGLACAVGLIAWLWQWQARPRAVQVAVLENPLPYSEAAIAAGRDVYTAACQECHGPEGAGDGPLARTLNQAPIDLRIHAQPGVHSDGTLFLWITQGIPGTPMPAFATALNEIERWQLVHYLRRLAEAGSIDPP